MLESELESARADPRRRFGRYLLLSELGRGGMGVVYRAWDDAVGRLVALKVLPEEDAEGTRRFARESQAMASLAHPGLMPVFDAGVLGGRRFLVMPLLEGGTLKSWLRAGGDGVPLARRVAVVRDVARAVHAAHERGIVHRDLKPENVLLDREGRPYVADFGLARFVDGKSKLTATGTSIGTPAYMPPEQIEGGHVDARADVYALGAMLYFAVAGRPPFEGATAINIVTAVLRQDAAPPSSFAPEVPRALDAIVLRCLEKEPGARYASADALAQALDAFLTGSAAPTGPRRRSPLALVAGALAVAGLGIAAAALVRGRPQAPEAPPAPSTATPAPAPSPPPALGPRTPGPVKDLELLATSRLVPELKEVALSPDGAHVAAVADDGSVRVWRASDLQEPVWLKREQRTESHWAQVRVVAFTPDGARLVTAGNVCHVSLRDVRDGTELATNDAPELDTVWDVEAAPDGRVFAVGGAFRSRSVNPRPEGVYELDPDSLAIVARVDGPSFPPLVENVAAVPGARTLLAVGPASRGLPSGAFVLDGAEIAARTLVAEARPDAATLGLGFPRVTPGGLAVIGVRERFALFTWAMQDGAGALLDGSGPDGLQPSGDCGLPFVALAGDLIVAGSRRLTPGAPAFVTVWEQVDGTLQQRLAREAPGGLTSLDAVGDTIVSGGADGVVRLWRLVRDDAPAATTPTPTPERVGELAGGVGEVRGLAFSPDGSRLAVGHQGGRLRLWDLTSGWERPVLAWEKDEAAESIGHVVFSPDGQRIVCAGNLADVVARDLTGQVVARNEEPGVDKVWGLVVRSTGTLVALSAPPTMHAPFAMVELDRDLRQLDATTPPEGSSLDLWRGEGPLLVTSTTIGRSGFTLVDDPVQLPHPDPAPPAETKEGKVEVWNGVFAKKDLVVASVRNRRAVCTWRPGAPEGRVFESPEGGSTVIKVAVAGDTVIAGGGDGVLSGWRLEGDAASYRWAVPAHAGEILALAVAPDGVHFASGGQDGVVRLWRLVR